MRKVNKYIVIIVVLGFICSCHSQQSHSEKAYELIKNSAQKFGREYVENYVCVADFDKIVYRDSIPIQLLAMNSLWASFDFNQDINGFYFEDANMMGRYLPLDSFASDLFIKEIGSVSPLSMFVPNSIDNNVPIQYKDDFDSGILVRKRALEKYGPLNVPMIKNYSYELLKKDKTGFIIKFTSKKKISQKNRIFGTGYIHLDTLFNVRKIEVSNLDDRYSSYIRKNTKMDFITDSYFRVTYGMIGNGIVADSVIQTVKWKKPEKGESKEWYLAEWPPYKNPSKYNLSSQSIVVFNNFICEDSVIQSLKQSKLFLEGTDSPQFVSVRESDLSYWDKHYCDISASLSDSSIISLFRNTEKQGEYQKLSLADVQCRILNNQNISEEQKEKQLLRYSSLQATAKELYERLFQ